MYFSGHMIDNYSHHIAKLGVDRISEILDDFSEDSPVTDPKYKDKSQVKIAGIITSKKTKVTKNGSTMAFITVEDRFAEIEVIVFAKQYSIAAKELFVDNAVVIQGNISAEEGEEPTVLMSELEPLLPNSDIIKQDMLYGDEKKGKLVYIRVKSQKDERIPLIYRISALNRGAAQVVVFDDSTRKCLAMKNICIDPSEKVIQKLKDIFGSEDVVLK